MATIKVGIDVSDNGTTKKATDAAERLKSAYDSAAKSAKSIGVGQQSSSMPKTGMAAQSQAITTQELVAYNRQRAVAQRTGASARDFAKEAEGLGGLVRLYATFAANVFAVSAAFNALSNAMDTTNMIKGLDQLGAASGQALGGLSKRFVEVTDGAISLRESVESVAKASAAGLSSKQILQIGENAKKASQALGVNMSDAVSRLTRGITKLEPELLDELGIYTKLEESVNKYALSVGKTASSLTDFERRQAFAVAVLDEANKKFGAIELDTNPYNKLLATFRDVTFAGLELVNKGLTPIVSLLSQSPVALAGILGLIAKQLVSSALPALAQYRQGLDDQVVATKQALEAAQARRAQNRNFITELEAETAANKDRAAAAKADLEVEKARAQFASGRKRPAVLAALPTSAELLATEPDLDKLTKASKEVERRISLIKQEKTGTEDVNKKREREINLLIAANKAINDRIQAGKQFNDFLNENVVGTPGALSKVQKDQRDLEKATRAARGIEIVQDVAQTYDTSGFNEGFKKLGTSIANSRKELGFFRTALVGVQGATLLLAGGISQVMSALNPLLFIVTAAVTAFGFLDGVMSSNKKQAEDANMSFGLLDEALKNIDKTATALSKKDPLERLSASSIAAKAKSVSELSSALGDLVEKVEAQDAAAGKWDKFVDGFKVIWGGDLLSKSSDKLTESITKLLNSAGGPEAEQASKKLKELVGVDPRDQEAFRKALQESPQKFLELAPKVAQEAQNLTNKLTALAGSAQQASDDINTASKSQSEFVTSALPSDKLSKFGSDLVKAGVSIKNALKDANSELSVLQNLLKNPNNIKLFSKDFQDYFIKNRDSIAANLSVLSAYRAELSKLERQQSSSMLRSTGSALLSSMGFGGAGSTIQTLRSEIKRIEAETAGRLKAESERMIQNGLNFLSRAAEELLKKAAGIINSAKVELLGNTEEAIRERTKIDNMALDAQIAVLETEKSLIGSQDRLQQAIELQTLAVQEQTAEQRAATQLQAPGADRTAIESGLRETLLNIAKARREIQLPSADNRLSVQAQKQISAQVGILQSQKQANLFREASQLIDLNTRKQEENNNVLIRRNESIRDSLEFEKQTFGVLSEQKQLQLETANREILRLQQVKERLPLEAQIEKINLVANRPSTAIREETEITRLLERRVNLEREREDLIDSTDSRDLRRDTAKSDKIKQQIADIKSGRFFQDSSKAAVTKLEELDNLATLLEQRLRNTIPVDIDKIITDATSARDQAVREAEEAANSLIDRLNTEYENARTERFNKATQDREALRKLFEDYGNKRSTSRQDTPAIVESRNKYLAARAEFVNAEEIRKRVNKKEEEAKDKKISDARKTADAVKTQAERTASEQIAQQQRVFNTTQTIAENLNVRLAEIYDERDRIRTEQWMLAERNTAGQLTTLEGELDLALKQEFLDLEAASQDLDKRTRNTLQDLQNEIKKVEGQIKSAQTAVDKARAPTGLGASSRQEQEIRLEQLNESQARDRERSERESNKRTLENRQQQYEKAREFINKLAELDKRSADLIFEEQVERINTLEKLGMISTETQIKRKADLEKAQEKKNLENRLDTLGKELTKEVDVLRDRQRIAFGSGQQQQAVDLQTEIDAITNRYKILVGGEEALSKARQDGITQIKEQNLLLESQNKLVSALENVAKALGDAFGQSTGVFFNTFAVLAKTEADFINRSTTLAKTRAAEEAAVKLKYKEDEVVQTKALIEIEKKYENEFNKLGLQNIQQQAAATKGFFKEKTFAYKALSIVEKVAAAQTLALNLQTMASNLAALPGKIAGGVGQLVSQGGFAGLAAAAGFLALMASLGFKKGGAKVTPSVSLEEVRKTQTTGQFYSGNTLMTRAGALQADPTETLNSIDESLEIIKSSGFDDLAVFNKMSKSLDRIDLNTRALSERLAISIGSVFSELQGGVTNENPLANLASNPVVKTGTTLGGAALGYVGGSVLAGSIAGPLGGLLAGAGAGGALTGSILGGLGAVGGPIGLLVGALLGSNLDKIITGIFGGKKTTTVRDFGITVEGTINKLTKANAELVKGFAELDVKISGGWFSRNRYFLETATAELDPEKNKPIFEYIGVLFSDIRNSLLTSAEVLGKDIDSVLETAVIEPLQIRTKDLKPEEIANAIKNQTSAAFNEIAKQAFGPLIEALRQPLEEAGTTLTRLTAQTQAFSDGMLLLGKNVEDITGTLKTIIADDLVKAFGNLENYQNKVQFFRENFLTEAEQIAPVSQKLTEELNKLGISTSLTRDQYKSLVLQQDLTTTSGRETFTALLNLGEAFDKVTDFAEKAKEKLDGFSTTIRNFIKEQTLQIAGSTNGLNFLLKEFQSTVEKSLQGDEKSLSYLTEIAGKTIESARSSSRTTREFNLLRAGVVSSLAQVATEIETGNIKLLTPQEQTNVILEQIEQNTSSLPEDIAQKLANKIDGILNPVVADTTTTATTLPDTGVVNDSSLGEGQGGPTSSGPVGAGTLALANAVANATNTLADTIKGNPLLGLVPGAGLIVLSNAAANDVISQAGREAEALGAVGAAVAAGVDAVSSSVDGPAGLFGYAKGGAFHKGINMFESGAAFSNSVVSNPTLFPMGVMGEAGPEAIMPLTRMNDGSLGVTADIPFNNNSQSNQQLIQEVRELKKEMEKVRIGVEVTATGTNKTFRLLDRVTENGDALNVLAVEGSVTTLSSIQGGQF
jgi:hypothetical protein